jgi:hypothetical protein
VRTHVTLMHSRSANASSVRCLLPRRRSEAFSRMPSLRPRLANQFRKASQRSAHTRQCCPAIRSASCCGNPSGCAELLSLGRHGAAFIATNSSFGPDVSYWGEAEVDRAAEFAVRPLNGLTAASDACGEQEGGRRWPRSRRLCSSIECLSYTLARFSPTRQRLLIRSLPGNSRQLSISHRLQFGG